MTKIKSALDAKKVFIFDMDGTITDTEPLHLLSYDRTLAELCSSSMEHDEFLKNYVGHSETDIYSLMRKNKGIDFDDDEFFNRRIANLFKIVKEKHLVTAPFFRKLCEVYKDRKFVMLTSQRESVLARFRELVDFGGISAFFSVASKPYGKKDVLAESEKYLGCKRSETVIFEDYPLMLKTAKSLGVYAVGVQHSLNHIEPTDCDCIIKINAELVL